MITPFYLFVLIAGDFHTAPEGHRFSVLQTFPFEAFFGSGIAVADFNADGFDELAVGAFTYGWPPFQQSGAVFLIDGPSLTFRDVRFGQPRKAYDRYGGSVAAGDMNGDGFPELAVSWEGGGEVLRGPSFRERMGTFVGGGSVGYNDHIVFRDIDGDGYQDLIEALLFGAGRVEAYFGPDMVRTMQIKPPNGYPPFDPRIVVAGDVDADGKLDLIVSSPTTPKGSDSNAGLVFCFFGDDYSRVTLIEDPTPLDQGYFGGGLAAGDYDADGFVDVAVNSASELCPQAYRCGEALAFFGPDFHRTHRFPDPPEGKTEIAGTLRVATGEVDGDGIDDLLISTTQDAVYPWPGVGSIYVFHGPKFFPRERVVPVDVEGFDVFSGYGEVLEVGDVTGDGLQDLVVGAPFRDVYGNGQAGMVHVYDFSTRFPFRSYGPRCVSHPTLMGVGDGSPDGSSRLVVDGLSGGATLLLIGDEPISFGLPGLHTGGCEPRLLVLAKYAIDLGSGVTHTERVLRLRRDISLGLPLRIRFQALDSFAGGVRSSNGVVWTVQW